MSVIRPNTILESEFCRTSKGTTIAVLDNCIDPDVLKDSIVTLQVGAKNFSRASVIAEDGKSVVDKQRTSHTASIPVHYKGKNLAELHTAMLDAINAYVDVSLEDLEGFVINQYSKGAQYKPHYDFFDTLDHNPVTYGNRYLTIIFYLNDDFTGGETAFPELGLQVVPKAGRMLIFEYGSEYYDYCHAQGTCRPADVVDCGASMMDKDSLHAGCPIKSGVKYIVTCWFNVSQNAIDARRK